MARSLRNSKVDDFEPKRKNPIGLLDDSNLDSHLKLIKIGDKSTPLQLSDTEFRVDGNFYIGGKLTSDALRSDNDIEINADGGDVVFKDNTLELATINDSGLILPDNTGVKFNTDSDSDRIYGDGSEIIIAKNDTDVVTVKDDEILQDIPLKIKESADAVADSAGYGQIWVDTQTPNCLAFTDDAGTDIIGIGKYHYETKFIGYNASATAIYLPMTGYVIEGTSTTSRNEFQGFCAPFNGTIEKVAFRSEIAQNGNLSFRVLEASDGTEIPGTMTFRKETAVNIADDIYQELDMTSPSIGSDYSPLTKGRIYQLYLSHPSAPYDANITMVFKWDITS